MACFACRAVSTGEQRGWVVLAAFVHEKRQGVIGLAECVQHRVAVRLQIRGTDVGTDQIERIRFGNDKAPVS
jgi:hypothetical protein